jgi:Tol biopolymer transport system component
MKAALGGDRPPSVMTLLRDDAANYHAALSPDGDRLAFDSDRDGVRAVYVSGTAEIGRTA